MKNPFKKKSLADTLINVGVGGAANVGVDYLMDKMGDSIASLDAQTKNIIKVVGGAVIGGMVANKYARAAADGVATVGVSNLVADLVSSKSTSGLPYGTVGRIRPGFAKARARKRGLAGTPIDCD